MPFAGYENFAACIADQKSKGKSEESARKICGALQRDHEKSKSIDELIDQAIDLFDRDTDNE